LAAENFSWSHLILASIANAGASGKSWPGKFFTKNSLGKTPDGRAAAGKLIWLHRKNIFGTAL
jgi:hypothetical protein